MPVPFHRRRPGSAQGKPASRAQAVGVLVAVFAALATGLVGSLLEKEHADSGDYIVLGVVIAVVAVGGGVALAKAIGRRGGG